MKQFIGIFLSLGISVMAFAQSPEMLTCSQASEITDKISEINATNWCEQRQSLELEINKVLPIVLYHFNEKTVNPIMLDNIHNPNWLAQKSIHDLREHRLCLETICRELWNTCNTGKNFNANNEQSRWCSESINAVFAIQQLKIATAVSENQKRKTRSAEREKFRAIEIRSSQYFSRNIISFASEIKRFTEKITAFILSPLS